MFHKLFLLFFHMNQRRYSVSRSALNVFLVY